MSTIYKNLTYDELVKLAPKNKPFQIGVESNVYGNGGHKVLWANFYSGALDTQFCSQDGGYDSNSWEDYYNGKFDLIIDPWDNFSRVHFNEGDILEDITEEDSPQYKLIIKVWDNSQQDDSCVLKSTKETYESWHSDLLESFRRVANPERKKTEYSLKEVAEKLNVDIKELRIKE